MLSMVFRLIGMPECRPNSGDIQIIVLEANPAGENYNNFSKPTAITGEIAAFFTYSHFHLTRNVCLSIQLNCCLTLNNDLFFV